MNICGALVTFLALGTVGFFLSHIQLLWEPQNNINKNKVQPDKTFSKKYNIQLYNDSNELLQNKYIFIL